MSFIAANKVYTSTKKSQSFESRRNSSSFFLPGVDASHVYVRALALGCFYSHISTRTFRRALTASPDSCAEIKSAPSVSGVTKSGTVWRKVPESDARSGPRTATSALTQLLNYATSLLLLSSSILSAGFLCRFRSTASFKLDKLLTETFE